MRDERKQYKYISKEFLEEHEKANQLNREMFWDLVGDDLTGKTILDLCCGDGYDLVHYQSLGATCFGLDQCKDFVNVARKRLPAIEIVECLAEKAPFADEIFDCIFSKYAIMTAADMNPIFKQAHRMLKRGGTFLYLVTHPMRQFEEKCDPYADYEKQVVVESSILNGKMSVYEPSHTEEEYFTDDFLSKFRLVQRRSAHDPAAAQIGTRKYPGFLILKWIKI